MEGEEINGYSPQGFGDFECVVRRKGLRGFAVIILGTSGEGIWSWYIILPALN